MASPYYILAPDYTKNSAGVQALYELCNKLNELSCEAYIVGSKFTAPSLNAPIISEDEIAKHQRYGGSPIAVYPEVVSGNPLNCKVCVRYMLNAEGVINDCKINASASDLFFYYGLPSMAGQKAEGRPLEPPIINPDIFRPPKREKRFRKILFLNRLSRDVVDFDELPDDVVILSPSDNYSHTDLAKIFQESVVLYSYEHSTTCMMAILCGCPLVIKGFGEVGKLGFNESVLSAYKGGGYCFGDDSDSLRSAVVGGEKFRQHVKENRGKFDQQVIDFINLTQDQSDVFSLDKRSSLPRSVKCKRSRPKVTFAVFGVSLDNVDDTVESVFNQTVGDFEVLVFHDINNSACYEKVLNLSKVYERTIIQHNWNGAIGDLLSLLTRLVSGEFLFLVQGGSALKIGCAEKMLAAFKCNPNISIVSSRRFSSAYKSNPRSRDWCISSFVDFDAALNGRDLRYFLARRPDLFVKGFGVISLRSSTLKSYFPSVASVGNRLTFGAGLAALFFHCLNEGDFGVISDPLFYFSNISGFKGFVDDDVSVSRGTSVLASYYSMAFEIGDLNKGGIRVRSLFEENRHYSWLPFSTLVDSSKIEIERPPLSFTDRSSDPVQQSKENKHIEYLVDWYSHRCPSLGLGESLVSRISDSFDICVVLIDVDCSISSVEISLQSISYCKSFMGDVSCVVLTTNKSLFKTGNIDDFEIRLVDTQAIADEVNKVFSEQSSSWFLVLRSGVELSAVGLVQVALEAKDAPESCLAIYGDALVLESGQVQGALLRPDFNLDMLLSQPTLMAQNWLYRREVVGHIDGFCCRFGAYFELDAIFRMLEKFGFGAFGHVSEILCLEENLDDFPGQVIYKSAITEHLDRRGYFDSKVSKGAVAGTFEVIYGAEVSSLVSIAIVSRGDLVSLQACMEAILEKTVYSNYEILIFDNNSVSQEMKLWLEGLSSLSPDKIRVVRSARTVNRSRAINLLISEAKGEFVLLMDSDIGVIRGDWLDKLLNHAQRPEVGVVGAKVLGCDGRVDSGGIIQGFDGVAGKAFKGLPSDSSGYMNRLLIDQNWDVLSSDCMLFSKTIAEQVGSFDEQVNGLEGSVDFCLRVSQAGYLNVFNPGSVVMHLLKHSNSRSFNTGDETESCDDFEASSLFYRRWLPQLAHNSGYNSAFTLKGNSFEIEQRIDLSWQPHKLLGLPTLLAHPADRWGCGHYRVIQPLQAMKDEGVAGGMVALEWLTVPEMAKIEPDACVFQRQITDEALTNMKRARHILKRPVVFELDDYLPNLPLKSAYRKNMPKDILKSLRRSLKLVDRFVVSTYPLAEAFRGVHPDIRVVENRLPIRWWESLTSNIVHSEKPRVGWAGGIGHTGDLEVVESVVRDLAEEVDWVFFGMCPERLIPFVKEVHEGVDISFYPQKLASLGLDLAIAPLEDNLFNRCKSNLKLLEYGACGFPVVCSDLEPYREHNLPVTRVKNRYKDWLDAIRMHLGDLNESARQGDELKRIVRRDWMLEGENLQQWLDAWTKF